MIDCNFFVNVPVVASSVVEPMNVFVLFFTGLIILIIIIIFLIKDRGNSYE